MGTKVDGPLQGPAARRDAQGEQERLDERMH